MIARDSFASSICAEFGYAPGTPRSRVVAAATELAYVTTGSPDLISKISDKPSYAESRRDFERRLRKERRAEEKRLRKQIAGDVETMVRADPQAYGFTGLEMMILWWIVSSIVGAIVRKLLEMWRPLG